MLLEPGGDRIAFCGELTHFPAHGDACERAAAGFSPWKNSPAPATEFRALWEHANLYFSFLVQDSDVVVLERLGDEQDTVFEDRVEVYLSRDERLQDYFCFEVDSRGRVFDSQGSYYRRFDPKWSFPGLETKAVALPDGYEVEGRIPLRNLEALGFAAVRPGVKIRCGLYRAEFSGRSDGVRPFDVRRWPRKIRTVVHRLIIGRERTSNG